MCGGDSSLICDLFQAVQGEIKEVCRRRRQCVSARIDCTQGRFHRPPPSFVMAFFNRNDNSEAQASSYQREPSPPSGGDSRSSREGSFVQAIRRAFSLDLDYTPVPVSERNDVELARRHRGGPHHTAASNRKFVMLAALIVPFVLFTIWIGKENSSRNKPIPLIKPSDEATASSASKNQSDAACPHVDPVQTLRASSTLEGLKKAAVATDHPVCSQIGLAILEMGGNAVDAAVAVALCLGVANPASSGMGGGAFLLVHADPVTQENEAKMPAFNDARDTTENVVTAASGKVTEVIDCREIAPEASATDMYKGLPDLASVRGGLSIGVPGELRGLELAHARHGKLPWSSVIGPIHQLAVKGVTVNANFAHEIQIMYQRYHRNNEFPELRKLLTKNDKWSQTLKEGDVLRNPALAKLLGEIRDQGADALYTGKRAEHFAKDIQEAGGIVTKKDIESYRATLRSPVFAHNIEGYSIVGVPPPSSGGAAIIGAARFLSGFSDPLVALADTLSTHRIVEAEKHAFSIRMSLSDPAFNTDQVKEAVDDLTRGTYMEELRQLSEDSDTLPISKYGGEKWSRLNDGDGTQHAEDADEGDRRRRLDGRRFGNLEDNGTSHFSIVDQDGNAVAMTTSVNTYFGSNVVSPSTGKC